MAFTGSQHGGLALWRLANEREVVIPVFAEMGTVNPVVVTPDAAAADGQCRRGLRRLLHPGLGPVLHQARVAPGPRGKRRRPARRRSTRASSPSPAHADPTRSPNRWRRASASCDRREPTWSHTSRPKGPGGPRRPPCSRAHIDALEPGSRLLEECFGAVALVCEYDDLDRARAHHREPAGGAGRRGDHRWPRGPARPSGAGDAGAQGGSRRGRRLAHRRRLQLGPAARRTVALHVEPGDHLGGCRRP